MGVAVARELGTRTSIGPRPIPAVGRDVVGGQQQDDMVQCRQPRGIDNVVENVRVETWLAWPGETLSSTPAGIQEHAHGVEAPSVQPIEDGGEVVVVVDSHGEATVLQMPIFSGHQVDEVYPAGGGRPAR